MARLVIIGNAGAGKSTLARELSRRLSLKHVEIDALAFESGFKRLPIETVNERLARDVASDDWVVEGMHNLELARWAIPRAHAVIWLDLSWRLISRRLLARTMRRAFAGANLARELRFVVKALRAHKTRRREHEALLIAARSAGCSTFHLRSRSAVQRWLHGGDELLRRSVEQMNAPRQR